MDKNERLNKIGQRLTIGFPGTSLDEQTIGIIRKYRIGNVILFQRNVESRKQLKELTDSIKSLIVEVTGIEPFIMIDQEGGMVTRLSDDFVNVPGAMALHATGNSLNARICGQITGRELSSAGVNFDLAPVLDVNCNPNNPVIGVRSYGEEPGSVIDYGIKMMTGLDEKGIISCAKHFPGHGDTAIDSHLGLPIVNKSLEQLELMELKPFEAAVKAGIPSIMTTHILFPQLDDSGLPATMSPVILRDILRKKMGYKGLIVSDCMEMGAISQHFGTVNAIGTALENGVDIACVSHHAELAAQAMEQIVQANIDEDQLRESYDRILTTKVRYVARHLKSRGATADDAAEIDRIGRSSVTICNIPQKGCPELGSRALFIGCLPFVVTMASNPENEQLSFARQLQEGLGGQSIVSSIDPDADEVLRIAEQAKGCSCIILGTYNGHVKRGQIALGKALEKLGIPMIVIALRNPYDLAFFDRSTFTMAVYEYSQRSLDWLKDFFRGQLKPQGKPFFSLEVYHA